MKFPREIEVNGYEKVTVEHGKFTVSLRINGGEGEAEMELALFASESKALRKALKAAEALLTPPIYLERNTTV